MITSTEKKEIIAKFGGMFGNGPTDAGCSASQIAILTARINGLSEHFAAHKKDYHSNRGLLVMIGQRKKLLKYVTKKDPEVYKKLIKELGLRK